MSALEFQLEARIAGFTLSVPRTRVEGTTAVLGPNGAGKTSLLLNLLGARRPASGRVSAGETVLFDSAALIDVPIEARRLGYVPQQPTLFAHLDVLGNVAFGGTGSRAKREAEARALLTSLGLEALQRRRPRQLSGGEAQKVSLARALAIQPAALLLDEPLAALDVSARAEVREWLALRLNAAALPTLLVTHDAEDVAALASRVLLLEAGRSAQEGTVEELRRTPSTPFARALLR